MKITAFMDKDSMTGNQSMENWINITKRHQVSSNISIQNLVNSNFKLVIDNYCFR